MVQGDWMDQDFLGEVRKVFAQRGIDLQVVAVGTADYNYSIILTYDHASAGPAAAAAVLDASGNLVASAAHSGFRQRGAVSGCAAELADKIGRSSGSALTALR
jgi:hypothetical protein